MARQLNLDRDQLDLCYSLAQRLVSHAAKYLDRHSSPAVERASLMLLGVEGEYRGTPLATLLVETLTKDQLRLGAVYWWGRALLGLKQPASELAEKLGRGKLKWTELPEVAPGSIKKEMEHAAKESLHRFEKTRRSHKSFWQRSQGPKLAVRLTDGKAKRLPSLAGEWHKKGASWILLDSPQKIFFEETFVSEEWIPAFRDLKDVPSAAVLRGLSLPEQTVTAYQQGLGTLSLEGWMAALLGEVECKRALIDLSFSLSLARKWSLHLLSEHALFGEKFSETFRFPQLLTTLLLYEQLAARQGVSLENIVLSAPAGFSSSGDFSLQLAESQVLREMFPQSFLWCRFSPGLDPFSFFAAAMTEQDVLEVSPEELPRAREWLKNLEGISRDFSLNTYGRIGRQAHQILEQTFKILKQMEQQTLWKVFDEDFLKTKMTGGKNLGQEGVFQKSYHYFNPVVSLCQGSASS